MAISLICPSCQSPFRLGDELAGKMVKCQKCQHVFRVPDYLRARPGATSARTDARGRAVLELPADRPFELVVAIPGREPESISFEGPGELTDAARVLVLPPGIGATGAELRCTPVVAKP